jgi:histidinol-phosphatase (PHP family)
MFDSHIHTPLCHHAIGAPLEYAHEAVLAGLDGICFTEHMPLPNNTDANLRLTQEEILMYREMIYSTKQLCSTDLEVRCGLEMDFIPGIEAFSQALLEDYQWDYIIGSVHRVGELSYGIVPAPQDLESYWQAYYNLIIAAAQSSLYDSIGHLDLPKRWVETPSKHMDMVLPALDAIAKHGLALDLNTSGFRGKYQVPHPPLEILREANTRGIPIVLGSDAHAPEDVASHFETALGLAKAAGYSEVVSFKNRILEPYVL